MGHTCGRAGRELNLARMLHSQQRVHQAQCTLVIPALGRWRPEAQECKASLSYTESSRQIRVKKGGKRVRRTGSGEANDAQVVVTTAVRSHLAVNKGKGVQSEDLRLDWEMVSHWTRLL